MVKRYHDTGMGVHPWQHGDYVLASDFDKMRRRLVVKLLREKSFLYSHAMRNTASFTVWCDEIADAIERGEPLEYFNRLGQDK